MLKNKKSIISLLSMLTILGIMSVNVSASVVPKRISGEDRVKTSIAVASENWTKSDYAVIAYAWDFPDAVSASPLAFKYKAPILLTNEESLNVDTDSKLSSLQVKHVFIVGGTGVVSENVEAQIKAKGIDVQRISGKNRYETSIAIAKQVGTSSSVVITNGYTPFDAMSIASIASKKGMPIILTESKSVPESVVNYLKQNNITQTYILGTADGLDVDEGVADNSVFPNPIRITGTDLYERNINILKKFDADIDYSKAYIATGKSFADALSGSVLAAITSSPVIFVDDDIKKVTREFIASKFSSITDISILGGIGAVSGGTVRDVEILLATGPAGITGTITTFTLSNGYKYVGAIKNGMFNGEGSLTLSDGNKYEGEFKDSEPNGKGTLISASGDKMVGEFKYGKFFGQGTIIGPDGDKYEGKLKNSLYDGQGTLTSSNGDKYVGQFKNDKFNGQGILTSLDGYKYVGEFKDNEFNGKGILTKPNGYELKGLWKNGKYIEIS